MSDQEVRLRGGTSALGPSEDLGTAFQVRSNGSEVGLCLLKVTSVTGAMEPGTLRGDEVGEVTGAL